MKREEMITKKDFILRGEWDRPRYGDLTPRYYYYWVSKKTGYRLKGTWTNKKAASAHLGKVIKIMNGIKSGKYIVVNGKVQKAQTEEK